MIRIFLDASVLFAAAKSPTGASYAVITACRKGKFQGIISEYILREVRRNAVLKFDQVEKQRLNKIVLSSGLKRLPEGSSEAIAACCEIIREKDAPVLAAALNGSTDYLVTLDYHDFLIPQVREYAKPMVILTPRDLIERFL